MTTSQNPRRPSALPIGDAPEQADPQDSPGVHDESTVRLHHPDDAETVLLAHGEPAATVHLATQPTEQPTDRQREQLTIPQTEQPTIRQAEQPTILRTEQPAIGQTEQPTSQQAEQPTEQLTERLGENSAERRAEPLRQQLTDQLTRRPTAHPTAPMAEPGAPDEAREYRFGPGVPAVTATDNRLASLWHGTVSPDERPGKGSGRRRGPLLGGWLLPLVVLIAVLAYLGWQHLAPGLAVTGVAVHSDPVAPQCAGTAVITGTLKTNGRPGEVTYRWKRSDGTVSEALHQSVAGGTRRTDVVLRWSFSGHGVMRATATLEVLSPDAMTASTTFTYTCR